MKKYFVGIVAVALSVLAFAFTNVQEAKRFDCSNSNLAWFIVPGSCQTTNSGAFSAVQSNNVNSVFVGTRDAFLADATNPGCGLTGQCVCAFGIDKSKLTLVTSPNIYAIPASGVTSSDIECVTLKDE